MWLCTRACFIAASVVSPPRAVWASGRQDHMDAHPEGRQPPRAVDLRQARGPEVEIVACETYDFLLSLHVALASPERDYSDYAVGADWIEQARARCDAADHTALDTLRRTSGSVRPGGLHSTLISPGPECPAPSDGATYLAWLERP